MSLLRKGNISGEFWLPSLPICIFFIILPSVGKMTLNVSIMLGLAFCTLPKEDHFLLPLVYSGLEGPLVPWSQSHSGIRALSIGQVTPPSKLSPRCGPTLGSTARASHAPVTCHLSPWLQRAPVLLLPLLWEGSPPA